MEYQLERLREMLDVRLSEINASIKSLNQQPRVVYKERKKCKKCKNYELAVDSLRLD